MNPNWAELWERDPSLRFRNEDREYLQQAGRGEGCWIWVSPAGRRHTGFMDSVAAGLCRDAAARWLASKGDTTLVDHTATGGVARVTFDAFGVRMFAGATMDEALFVACKALLDEGKPSPGDAPACDGCGTITVRSGEAWRCLNCGHTQVWA